MSLSLIDFLWTLVSNNEEVCLLLPELFHDLYFLHSHSQFMISIRDYANHDALVLLLGPQLYGQLQFLHALKSYEQIHVKV